MEKRIFYHDTDAGGVVYYGTYLQYLEEARTEYLERAGLSVGEFRKRGLLYAVSHCSVYYRSPARYGETLVCDATLEKMTAARLIFNHTIHEKENGRLILEAEATVVCLTEGFKPTPIPDDLAKKLQVLPPRQ